MKSPGKSVLNRWQVSAQSDFIWCDWGDDYVAYHRPSSKTHYLNSASERLLTRILLQPKSAAEVAAEYPEAELDNAELIGELMEMLEHLEDLGLVDRL